MLMDVNSFVDPDPAESDIICKLVSGCVIKFRIRIHVKFCFVFSTNKYKALLM
jgi:hypothetical protein